MYSKLCLKLINLCVACFLIKITSRINCSTRSNYTSFVSTLNMLSVFLPSYTVSTTTLSPVSTWCCISIVSATLFKFSTSGRLLILILTRTGAAGSISSPAGFRMEISIAANPNSGRNTSSPFACLSASTAFRACSYSSVPSSISVTLNVDPSGIFASGPYVTVTSYFVPSWLMYSVVIVSVPTIFTCLPISTFQERGSSKLINRQITSKIPLK